jgi:hypothetical protein
VLIPYTCKGGEFWIFSTVGTYTCQQEALDQPKLVGNQTTQKSKLMQKVHYVEAQMVHPSVEDKSYFVANTSITNRFAYCPFNMLLT